jgi:hypothetical protein
MHQNQWQSSGDGQPDNCKLASGEADANRRPPTANRRRDDKGGTGGVAGHGVGVGARRAGPASGRSPTVKSRLTVCDGRQEPQNHVSPQISLFPGRCHHGMGARLPVLALLAAGGASSCCVGVRFELGPEAVRPKLSTGPAYQFPDAAMSFLTDVGGGARLMFPSDGKTWRTTGADLFHQGRPDPAGEVLGNGQGNWSYDSNGNWMLAAFRIGGARSEQLVGFTHVENHHWNCSGPYAEWNAAAVVRSSDDGRSWSREGLAVGDPQPCKPAFGGAGYSSVLRMPGGASSGSSGSIAWRGWGGCYGFASSDVTGAAGTWIRYHNGNFSQPGVGGEQSCLPGLGMNIAAPIVHWNTFLELFVMLTSYWGHDQQIWLFTSKDGVAWSQPQLLVNSSTHTAIAYGQIIGPNSSHEAGQEATLVYAASPATVKGAHRDFITRTIRFTKTDANSSVLPLKTDDSDGMGVNISITLADNRPVGMGQTAKVCATWVYSDDSAAGSSALVAFPFVNGSQWGAQLTLTTAGGGADRSNGNRTLLLPIPHAGLASLVLVVMRRPLSGVTVGVKLASLSGVVASSNTLRLAVHHRTIVRLGNGIGKKTTMHFGSQWEPIVAADGVGPGGGGAGWSSNEAVPLVGKYSAFDLSVLKQHAIWLAESGIDCICVDWSNNIGSTITRFEQVPAMSWKIINGTTFAIQGYEKLRNEGVPCPKIAIMVGVFAPPVALNGELEWIRNNYPASAFVTTLEGQPLLLMLDGGGPPTTHALAVQRSKELNTSGFTVRYTSAFLSGPNQTAFATDSDWWSWMDDGVPTVARRNGAAESVTISAAFFKLLDSKPGAEKGWLEAPAWQTDRRGGATFVRSMVTAFQTRPQFVWVHQWNEFIGVVPPEPPVKGKDFFGDEYNSSLSDDIEPSDLFECGVVRPGDASCGGWGFLFLNLQRALVSMLAGTYDDAGGGAGGARAGGEAMTIAPSLLTIAAPTNRQPIDVEAAPDDAISVSWVQLGARASHYTLALRGGEDANGLLLASATVNASGSSCQAPAEHCADGKGHALHFVRCEHRLSLRGAGSSLGGQVATVTVESMTSSPSGVSSDDLNLPHRLLTPFPLSLTEMDGGDGIEGGWVPTKASVSVVLGPPF